MRKPVLLLSVFLVLASTALAGPLPPRERAPAGETDIDSLNCRMAGNWPFGPAFSFALDLDRNLAFCGVGGGVYALDITDPSNPVIVSEELHANGIISELCYRDSMLYCAAGRSGLEIWDVSNPLRPNRTGILPALDNVRDVAVFDTFAYITDWDAGLRVISIADPANPRMVGWYDSPGAAYTVAFYQDTIAFVADWEEGAQVVNVANPADPFAIANIPYGTLWGVHIDGHLAFFTDLFSGLLMMDISDPRNPTVAGEYINSGSPDNVFARDSAVWLPQGYNGVLVLDISDPSSPQPVGTLASQGSCTEVLVTDTLLFVADWEGGIVIASVASPNPRVLARGPDPGRGGGCLQVRRPRLHRRRQVRPAHH